MVNNAGHMIRPFLVITVFMVLALGFSAECFAKAYPFLYRGVRPLGMGGAFTALADDENALFYNPAGLSAIKRLDLGVINPMVDVSKKSLDLMEDANDADMDDSAQVADLMRKYIGEHQHLQASLFPYAGFRVANVGILFGGLAQAVADADIHNPAWPELHLDVVQDTALLAGVGFQVPITGLRLGLAAKWIGRKSLEQIYTAADVADDNFEDRMEDDMNSGSGIALDVGAIYALSFISFVKTDLGVSVQNIPQLDMGAAKDIKTQANIGLAMEKSLAKFKIVGTLDYLDFTQNLDEDNDIGKRLHLGLELATPFFISLRTGINQGYWTVGATVDFRFVRLDFAAYTEEVGAYAGQRDDQRYIGQITFGW